jgi:hypothetical protein
MVALIPKTKRDKKQMANQHHTRDENSDFAGTLDKAIEKYNFDEFQTLTYNANSQLEPFIYVRHKEYTV